MDPLETKSLFILMSFQVNRRDFLLGKCRKPGTRQIHFVSDTCYNKGSFPWPHFLLDPRMRFSHFGNIFCLFPFLIREGRHSVIPVASRSPVGIPASPKAKPGWWMLHMHRTIKMVIY